jgi:hypothetical protein
MIEGVEEVTEQMVLDATKGIVDTMSYLGLTKKEGSFGGWDTAFSKAGFENYLANFVGGIIGGGMFEFHRAKIAPWLNPNILPEATQKSLYELVAAGHKEELIKIINSNRNKLGNKSITVLNEDGSFKEAKEGQISQADLIADKAIGMVNLVDGILNSHDLIHTDDAIISKAIKDKIIIDMLVKATPEKSMVGLEGLILQDYKSKMIEVAKLSATLKNTEDTAENKKLISETKSAIKEKVEIINNILEGKEGSNYFTKALFVLNKKTNSPFLNISKTDYTKEKYKVDYHDLPEKGIGLTKEKIDTE